MVLCPFFILLQVKSFIPDSFRAPNKLLKPFLPADAVKAIAAGIPASAVFDGHDLIKVELIRREQQPVWVPLGAAVGSGKVPAVIIGAFFDFDSAKGVPVADVHKGALGDIRPLLIPVKRVFEIFVAFLNLAEREKLP